MASNEVDLIRLKKLAMGLGEGTARDELHAGGLDFRALVERSC
jgi:hypothetical protein